MASFHSADHRSVRQPGGGAGGSGGGTGGTGGNGGGGAGGDGTGGNGGGGAGGDGGDGGDGGGGGTHILKPVLVTEPSVFHVIDDAGALGLAVPLKRLVSSPLIVR
jgi:hypothetical protein